MASSDNLKIEKLNDKNYGHWAFAMKNLLQIKKLWKAISEPAPNNPDREAVQDEEAFNTQLEAYNVWLEKDREAMNWIALNVNHENGCIIHNTESGTEAWQILKNHNSAASIGNKVRTRNEISRLKFNSNSSTMRNHLNVLQEKFNVLIDIGDPMTEIDKVIAVLNSVDGEFPNLVTAIHAWSEDRMTLQNVKERLNEEYERKKASRSHRISEALALSIERQQCQHSYIKPKANGGFQTDNAAAVQSSRRFPFDCFYCGRNGHKKADCHKMKDDVSSGSFNPIGSNKVENEGGVKKLHIEFI